MAGSLFTAAELYFTSAMPRFYGPAASPTELHWRGLVLRSEVEPPADVPITRPLLKATLRAGRWEVSPNQEGKFVAAWRHQRVSFTSTRDTQEAALEAVLRNIQNPPQMTPPQPLPELVEDLQALLAGSSGARVQRPEGDPGREVTE